MGTAAVASRSGDSALRDGSAGAALNAQLGRALGERYRLQLGSALTVTELLRTQLMWQIGYEVGAWTTQAYRDVYDWSLRGESALRIPASMVAYGALMVPYGVSAVLFALGPFAAISYTSLDLTLSRRFGPTGRSAYLEAGSGVNAHWLAESAPGGGLGPVAGAGVEWRHIELGTRLHWALRDDWGDGFSGWHLAAATLTFGLVG